MKSVALLEKTLFEMVYLLASNYDIQKLLYVDGNNLDTDFSDFQLLPPQDMLDNEYISIAPHLENGIENATRNTFLVVQLEDISLESYEGGIRASGAIHIVTDKQHEVLKPNHSRLLMLADAIINLLEHKKLSAAGEISFRSLARVVYSEYTFGYRLSFSFNDQQLDGRKAEI